MPVALGGTLTNLIAWRLRNAQHRPRKVSYGQRRSNQDDLMEKMEPNWRLGDRGIPETIQCARGHDLAVCRRQDCHKVEGQRDLNCIKSRFLRGHVNTDAVALAFAGTWIGRRLIVSDWAGIAPAAVVGSHEVIGIRARWSAGGQQAITPSSKCLDEQQSCQET
jgi:hypothetical protein